MSGMLGRAPTALVTSEVYHINNSNTNLDSSKRYCKAWPRSSSDQSSSSLLEPTSVLDIRSPSPSSTLSSSLAGSCEGGLGSIESGAVAVSGFICEGASEGQQLPDCSTSLLESHSHSHGQVRSVQEEMAGAWQQQGHNSDARQQVWSGTTATNSDGMMLMMKPQQQQQQIVSSSPSPSPLFEQGSSREQQQGSFSFPTDKIVKSEAIADGSLEACVMPFSCRKRDREDFLGEVVQRTGHGVLKVEQQQQQQGSWAGSEWCDVKPTAINELDEILVGSPAPPLSEFWLPEPANSATAPAQAAPSPSQLQFQQHQQHQQNQQQQSFANRGKQLDLYEAVQAGLLYRGSSSSPAPPSSTELSSAPGSLLNPNLQQQVNHGVLLNPNSIPRVGQGHVPQFLTQREQGSFPLRSVQLTYRSPGPFMDTKPPMFNQAAPFAPQMPQFGDSPANYPFTVPQPQFVPPKRDFVPDIKHCSIPRIIEGDPKMGGGGGIGRWPPMQKPPETGWQPPPSQRLPPGLGGFTLPEPPLLPHPRRELQVGRCVRVEELSQAERQLSAAAEAAGHGDLVMAQAILARLNQQSSPKGQQQQQLIQQQQQSQLQTPSQRVTLLFSEAMSKRLPAMAAGAGVILPTLDGLSSPADIIAKIGSFKSFCEVSPIPQFAHFTANQAILEATEGEDCIHLIDFELGLGGQWASFMQEFAQRRGKAELRITTIGGETVEMKLAKENLQQFAKEVGLKLEVVVLGVDRLEMVAPQMLRRRKDEEAVVVNFGFGMRRPAAEFRNGVEGAMAFLNMIKALSPKVVTVIDSDGELGEGNSMAEAMQYYACIFESLDGTKLGREAVQGIENLVFAPKVAEVVALRAAAQGQRRPDGLFSGGVWRFLLQKAGFSSAVFSAAAQSQAACLVKNPANSGFNFHAQQGTLQLGWYNKSLISASAWV